MISQNPAKSHSSNNWSIWKYWYYIKRKGEKLVTVYPICYRLCLSTVHSVSAVPLP